MVFRTAIATLVSALLLWGQGAAAVAPGTTPAAACQDCRCAHCDAPCCAEAPGQPLPTGAAIPVSGTGRDSHQLSSPAPAHLLYALAAPRPLAVPVSRSPALPVLPVPLFRWDCALLI
jgi:hypothetical protein